MNKSDFDAVLELERGLRGLPDQAYVDRHNNPVLHPCGIYRVSRAKVPQRMRAATEKAPLDVPRDEVARDWPNVASGIESMLLAMASHRDNLQSILDIAGP
jgi:hypothetical protein